MCFIIKLIKYLTQTLIVKHYYLKIHSKNQTIKIWVGVKYARRHIFEREVIFAQKHLCTS